MYEQQELRSERWETGRPRRPELPGHRRSPCGIVQIRSALVQIYRQNRLPHSPRTPPRTRIRAIPSSTCTSPPQKCTTSNGKRANRSWKSPLSNREVPVIDTGIAYSRPGSARTRQRIARISSGEGQLEDGRTRLPHPNRASLPKNCTSQR